MFIFRMFAMVGLSKQCGLYAGRYKVFNKLHMFLQYSYRH